MNLSIKITNPDKVLWEGKAQALSSKNKQGPFDILPGHANFITLIKDSPVIIHKKAKNKEFKFKRAVIFNKNNEVVIYVMPYTKISNN